MTTITLESPSSTWRLEELVDRLLAALFPDETEQATPALSPVKAAHEARRLRQSGDLDGALAAFNGGIELGQLAVIAGAAAALGWCRAKPWYRRRVTVPLSCGIALTGLAWAVERTLGG